MSSSAASQPIEADHIAQIKSRIGLREFIMMMAALMAMNAIAIDIMLPALEQIKHYYGAAGENIQHYVISVYMISQGIMQLVFGPLSDRFGRRKPLLIGLIFYSLASFACVLAPSFFSLLLLRALQGVGGAAARALCISVVRDLYGGRQMAEVMSIVMMVFMIVPVVAPFAGQTVMFWGPWQLIFAVIALAGLVVAFWVWKRLPETMYEARPLTLSASVTGFKIVLSNTQALCYTLAFSAVLGALFGSLYTAQQIYEGIYDLGGWFPLAFAAIAICQAIASYLNSRLVGHIGMRRLSHGALIVFLIASLIWLIIDLLSDAAMPLAIYMMFFAITMFCFGAMGANFNALAMEPLGKVAGMASSVFGFLQTIIGAGSGALIGQAFSGTTLPVIAGFFIVGILALVFVLIAEKGRLFRPQHGNPIVSAHENSERVECKKDER